MPEIVTKLSAEYATKYVVHEYSQRMEHPQILLELRIRSPGDVKEW